MAKLIKSTDKGFFDLRGAEAFTAGTKSEGVITIIKTTSGDRTKINKPLLADLKSPESVQIFFMKDAMVIVTSDSGDESGLPVKKDGVIYNTDLAKKIMEVSGGEFKPNASTRVGKYHLQEDDDGTVMAVVTFDKKRPPAENEGTEESEQETV